MTRATKFAGLSAAFTISYLLVWFSVLPIPFLAASTTDEILPVVRPVPRIQSDTNALTNNDSFHGGVLCLSGLIH